MRSNRRRFCFCISLSLALLALSAVPLLAQDCSRRVVVGPYTISPTQAPQQVKSEILTIRTKGKIVATYTLTRVGDAIQIKENNQPVTYDPTNNPLGLYSPIGATNFENGVCPDADDEDAVFRPLLRPAASSSLPLFGQTASQYVSADFNNDGVPDNATAGPGFVQITLYDKTQGALGNKNITIGGPYAGTIVAGDFNGDGNVDLAVSILTNTPPGYVAVLLGKGDGTFSAPVNYNAGAGPLSVAAVDLNGDGKLDLVVANSDETGAPIVGTVDVLLGKGDGTFAAPVVYPAGAVPVSVIATDLNGDGHPDIALLDAEPNGHDQLLVFLSNADGTLRAPLPAIATGTYLGQLAFTDLNGDGKLDLAIADQRGSDLTILMGNGDGTFQSAKPYANVPQPASVAVFPLTGGYTALLTSDAIDGSLTTTFVNPDGTVGAAPIQTLGKKLSAAVAADVNHDSKPDIVIADAGGNRVYVLVNSGNYQFTSPTPYALTGSPSGVAVADVTGDGKADLIVADTNGIDVLPGAGNGSFGAAQTTAISGASQGAVGPAVADFNGDGKPDVAVAVGGQLSILLGQANGAFSPAAVAASVSGSVSPIALVTGDFNGDGKPDLAFAYGVLNGSTYTGYLGIELGNGNGTFQSSTIQLPAGPLSVALGDVNKDGKTDLIVGLLANTGPQVAVFLGKGDGTFQNPTINVTGAYVPSINVVDFNGDGNLDLLLGDCCGLSEATVMYGNGDGAFQPEATISSGPNPSYLAVADFDGDGKPDLAIAGANNNSGTLIVERNVIPGVTRAAVVSTANPAGTALAPASLAAAYGTDLANSPAASTSLPLPTSFGGTSVSIRDSTGVVTAAPLVYVSTGQVNFLIPSTIAAGAATITVTSGDGTQSVAQVAIAPVAPGVFALNPSNLCAAVAVRAAADGSQTVEQVYSVNAAGAVVAAPIALGAASDQVVLSIFGTGLRAAGTAGVTVTIGGASVPVQYAGAQGQFDGLDQVNVTLPHSLAGKGSVTVQLTANGIVANTTNVTIQ